jgi:hypothetical protein
VAETTRQEAGEEGEVIAGHAAWWWIQQFSQILWFITLALVFWSGIKPFGKFSTKPYDRAIRTIGAGIILAMLLVGLVLYLRG